MSVLLCPSARTELMLLLPCFTNIPDITFLQRGFRGSHVRTGFSADIYPDMMVPNLATSL